MRSLSKNKKDGFTLLEIIITLVVAAIFGAMFVQLFGTAFTQSSVPIQRLNQALGLQQVMENITSDYKENYTSDLTTLSTRITNNNYGQYTVAENTFIKFVGTQPVESTLVSGDLQDILKVSIANDSGETLTALFICLGNCQTQP